MNDFIYDIECYPNVFTFSALHVTTGQRYRFEISFRKNEIELFLNFITWCGADPSIRWVGFNNQGYDYPVIHYIYNHAHYGITYADIYAKSKSIIDTPFDMAFTNRINDSDTLIQQVDLYLIHHFNNKARRTSLKMLEFNMCSPNIEDLPYIPGTPLTSKEIDNLIIYNDHDVDETYKFYIETKPMIDFREVLNEQYGVNWTNKNDTAIGKSYFIKELEELTPGVCYRQTVSGKKPNQTPRPYINLVDAVFPYIQFQRPEFNAILDWIKRQTITETKGVFSDILERDLGDVAQYAVMQTKRKRYIGQPHDPTVWYDYNKKKECFRNHREVKTLNTVIDGFQFVFGTGGIHGSVESQTVSSTHHRVVMDFDVKSYYPNLAIVNQLFPEHLGQGFCTIYKTLYEMRLAHPDKKDPINAMLKLALNGVYGDTNQEHSPFYDPLYTMRVTINGQLLLCMLAEGLMNVPGLRMIQINTDGLTVEYDRVHASTVGEITSRWQAFTCLELEAVEYSRMFIRDVNSYIAESIDGKIKRKGAYGYGDDLDWNQNYSTQVIAMAAEDALLNNHSPESFIMNHQNIYDFMGRTKVPRSSKLTLSVGDPTNNRTINHDLQNITRYYSSLSGGQLVKYMPPTPAQLLINEQAPMRRMEINAGQMVRPCNDITHAVGSDIDFEWYIKEANKLIDCVINF